MRSRTLDTQPNTSSRVTEVEHTWRRGRKQAAERPVASSMTNYMRRGKAMALPTTAVLVVGVVGPLLATNIKSPERQTATFHLAAAQAYNLHANDHARLIRKYAQTGSTMPAEVLRDHLAALKSNTQAAKTSFAQLRSTAGDNARLSGKIDQIDKRLTQLQETIGKVEKSEMNTQHVATQMASVSKELAANQADAQQMDDEFYNRDSANYYFTGEGHFID